MRFRSILSGTIQTLLGTAVLVGLPSGAVAQEVSYSLFPAYQEVRWDDAFGLERTRMLGAKVALDFGPYFSLQPFYFWENDVQPRDGLDVPSGQPHDWDIKAFGGDMVVNFGRDSFAPFVKGGGGVLRTRGTGEDEDSDRILLKWGGGLRFGLGSVVGAELYAENWTTRLSRSFVPGAVSAGDFPDDGLVDSWVYGVAARIPLGGGYDRMEGVRGLVPGFLLEPFAQRTDFSDEFDLGEIYGAGARAGVDFNQNVGLRAYYWRGVDDDFSEFRDVEGYGAEARLALNTGPGISPFGIIGAGRVRFTEDFLDLEGSRPDDLNHLTLGGGVSFGLGDHTRIDVGARNLLMTAPGEEIEDVTTPDELISNWQYSVGLAWTLGASARTDRDREIDRLRRDLEEERAMDERLVRTERERREMEDRRREELREGRDRGDGVRQFEQDGRRMMVVPVPEVGEVILRYGEAYAVRAPDSVEGMTAAELAALEARVAETLRARGGAAGGVGQEGNLAELVRDAVRAEIRAMGLTPATPARPGAPVVVAPTEAESVRMRREVSTILPYTGVQLGDQVQVMIGGRVNMGPISRAIPLDLVPELAFGFGEGDTSLLLGANARFGHVMGGARRFEPYVMAGAAITNRRLLSLNVSYGAEFDVRTDGSGRTTRLFLEHQGIQLFKDHRILVGVSLPR